MNTGLRNRKAGGIRIGVTLVEIQPSAAGSMPIRALAFRKNGRLFVTHVEHGSSGRTYEWTMPIDAKGKPPRGTDWAWRVADADVPSLSEAK